MLKMPVRSLINTDKSDKSNKAEAARRAMPTAYMAVFCSRLKNVPSRKTSKDVAATEQ